MDQVNQENELQKAIDDITRNNGITADAPADATAELEAKIQDQMGTPPVPPMPAVGETPAETMPPAEGAAPVAEAPAEAPAEASVEGATEETPQIIGSAGDIPAPATDAPVADAAPVDMGGDIKSVKEAMLRDLFPLMDKVEMGAEEKFELYKTMIDDTNDKSMIAAAYEVVKGISDEARRAEALLFLIKKADA